MTKDKKKSQRSYSDTDVRLFMESLASESGLEQLEVIGLPDRITENQYKDLKKRSTEYAATLAHQNKLRESGKSGRKEVSLTREQVCASLQFIIITYSASVLDNLDPDSEEAVEALRFIDRCKELSSFLWNTIGNDEDHLKVPLDRAFLQPEED